MNTIKNQQITTTTNNNLTLLSSFSWYYTGFVHSDGTFFIGIERNNSLLGFRLAPTFTISLGIDSKYLILDIAQFFGCGNVNFTATAAIFKVTDLTQIWNIIIPHFLKFPFSGLKFLTFKIFTICCTLLLPFYNKKIPYWTVFRVLCLSFLMNEGSRRTLADLQGLLLTVETTALQSGQLPEGSTYLTPDLLGELANSPLSINQFPAQFNLIASQFNLIAIYPYIELPYILGVIEGDGSFFIRFLSSSSIYSFGFNITTSIGDLPILILIRLRLGVGSIVLHETWCRLTIDSIYDLNYIIIPLIESLASYRSDGQNLLSHKANNFAIWKEGLQSHLNNEFSFKKAKTDDEKTLKKIALTNFIVKAYNVHDEGKKRKYTLKAFLKLHNLN